MDWLGEGMTAGAVGLMCEILVASCGVVCDLTHFWTKTLAQCHLSVFEYQSLLSKCFARIRVCALHYGWFFDIQAILNISTVWVKQWYIRCFFHRLPHAIHEVATRQCPVGLADFKQETGGSHGGCCQIHRMLAQHAPYQYFQSMFKPTRTTDADSKTPVTRSEDGGPKSEVRGSRFEVRGPRSEVRGSRFEVRGSRFGVRGSRFEVRGPRSEVRGSRFEVRGSRFEVRGPRFEVRGSRFEVRGPRSEVRGPRFQVRGSRFEVRGSRSEVRGSRFEVRGPRSEVRGFRSEVRGPRSEVRGSRFEVRGPRSEVLGSRFEVRGSRFEVRGPRFEVRGSRFEVRGSRSEVRGSRFEVRGPRSEVRGPRFEVRGSRFEVRGSRFDVRGSRFEVVWSRRLRCQVRSLIFCARRKHFVLKNARFRAPANFHQKLRLPRKVRTISKDVKLVSLIAGGQGLQWWPCLTKRVTGGETRSDQSCVLATLRLTCACWSCWKRFLFGSFFFG